MRREEEGPSKMHARHSTQYISTLLHTISRARLATLWQESVSLVQQGEQPHARCCAQHADLCATLLRCVAKLSLEATDPRMQQSSVKRLAYLCSCILISAEMPGRKDWSSARKIINEERSD